MLRQLIVLYRPSRSIGSGETDLSEFLLNASRRFKELSIDVFELHFSDTSVIVNFA